MNGGSMTQSNDLVPQPVGWLVKLANARQALYEARDDFERLQIRDKAKAVQEATKVLKYKDIQVHASLLVQDAERAIAKANPPQKRGPSDEESLEDIVARLETDVSLLKSSHLSITGDLELVKQSLWNLERGVEFLIKNLWFLYMLLLRWAGIWGVLANLQLESSIKEGFSCLYIAI